MMMPPIYDGVDNPTLVHNRGVVLKEMGCDKVLASHKVGGQSRSTMVGVNRCKRRPLEGRHNCATTASTSSA